MLKLVMQGLPVREGKTPAGNELSSALTYSSQRPSPFSLLSTNATHAHYLLGRRREDRQGRRYQQTDRVGLV